MVNWIMCPLCGVSPMEVKLEETLISHTYLSLSVAPDASLSEAEYGLSEPDYSSAEAQDFLCAACEQPLPPDFQDELWANLMAK